MGVCKSRADRLARLAAIGRAGGTLGSLPARPQPALAERDIYLLFFDYLFTIHLLLIQ